MTSIKHYWQTKTWHPKTNSALFLLLKIQLSACFDNIGPAHVACQQCSVTTDLHMNTNPDALEFSGSLLDSESDDKLLLAVVRCLTLLRLLMSQLLHCLLSEIGNGSVYSAVC